MIVSNFSNIQYKYELPDQSIVDASLDSNTVNTEILTYAVPKVKSSNKFFMVEGEKAQQSVSITNNSGIALTGMTFNDNMSSGATHVVGSVMVNGVSQPTYDVASGFPLPDLNPGESTTVQYNITANNPFTQSPVTNFATFNYSVNDPISGPVSFVENTNTIQIPIVSTKMSIVKSVNKAYAIKGDVIHYTNVITNTGSSLKSNLIFQDNIPSGTTFVDGSVKVNGVNYAIYNPQTGFVLENLAVGESVTIEFDVKVN